MEWSNKRVLVAGGAGMIGSHLARTLVGMGANVCVVDNLSSGSLSNISDFKNKANLIDIQIVDLRELEACLRVTEGFDYVFQFAANMGGVQYISSIGADIMRDSSLININMLHASLLNEVKQYCFSSSACVYSEHLQKDADVKPLKESDAWPAAPDQFYGIEKLFAEKLCEAHQQDYGMNIRVARFHNILGEAYTAFDGLKAKAPCHIILKVLQCPDGGEIEIWGDGLQSRSFLYIDDCIEGILKLMESDYGKPINIGSDRLVTINELARIIIGISGKRISIRHDLSKPQGVRGRNASLELVEKVLGWRPKISLEEGLERTYRWAEEHLGELEGIK